MAPTARTFFLASLLAALGALSVWAGTYQVDLTSWFDRGVQTGFKGLADTRIGAWAARIVVLGDPIAFAAMGSALIAIALVRRRWRSALMAAAILGGANVTTQALKHLTEGPRAWSESGGELWPSGHTTGAMTLALCLVLVTPRPLRPMAAAVGGCYAIAMVYSLMVLGHHLPSDSVGGFLVAAGWTFLILGFARLAERRWPTPGRHERPLSAVAVLWPVVAVAAFAAVAIAGIAVSRPDQTLAHAAAHTSFVLGAPLLGGLALALAGGVALTLRR